MQTTIDGHKKCRKCGQVYSDDKQYWVKPRPLYFPKLIYCYQCAPKKSRDRYMSNYDGRDYK